MIIGIDYADVDDNKTVDFTKARGAGVSFAILRGAWGTYKDPYIKRGDLRAARAAGLVCGTYLFLRYGSRIATPEDQVSAFVDNVGIVPKSDLPPALDVEFPGGRAATGFTVTQAIDWTKRAWQRLKDCYGVAPMIYTSARVWAEDLANTRVPEFEDSIAWLAKPWPWPVKNPARISIEDQISLTSGMYDPTVPPVWPLRDWWIHQYQGDALKMPGFPSTVDLNRFNPMKLGETGPRVAWVQKRLGMKITSVADGEFGDVLAVFQASRGLVADKIIGPRTLAAIAWCDGVEMPEPVR